jgi:hypothetical protein
MSNPFITNQTCDIYRFGGVAPVFTAVPFTLVGTWGEGQKHGVRNVAALMYTHIAHFELTVDIRDGYTGAMVQAATYDTIWTPDSVSADRCGYRVSFVCRVNHGQRADHLLAYLNRDLPNWPANDI